MTILKHKNIFILAIVIALLPNTLFSQNNTTSPYSYYGIGDLSNVGYGRNLAMGGTGYALRDGLSLNLKNPASLTAIDSLGVLYEMGVYINLTQSSMSGDVRYYTPNGNLTHLVIGHRINDRLMMDYGVMPYSDIGYDFATVKSVDGEETAVVSTWEGEGGLNKIFLGLGFKISENFSLGLEGAGYFGPSSEVVTTTSYAVLENPSIYTKTLYSTGGGGKASFQYYTGLGEKGSSLTVGGVFSSGLLLSRLMTETIRQSYSGSLSLVYLKEDITEPYQTPISYGGGITYRHRNKYLYTIDAETAPWGNKDGDYIDKYVFSLGFEKMPQRSLKYFENCSYRAGLRYDSGYLEYASYRVSDVRFTLGAGLPMLKSKSTLNVSLEAGQRGTKNRGLVLERYVKMSLALSFHDYWFIKRKID